MLNLVEPKWLKPSIKILRSSFFALQDIERWVAEHQHYNILYNFIYIHTGFLFIEYKLENLKYVGVDHTHA